MLDHANAVGLGRRGCGGKIAAVVVIDRNGGIAHGPPIADIAQLAVDVVAAGVPVAEREVQIDARWKEDGKRPERISQIAGPASVAPVIADGATDQRPVELGAVSYCNIEKFIVVALYLKELRNFNDLVLIVTAINSSIIKSFRMLSI